MTPRHKIVIVRFGSAKRLTQASDIVGTKEAEDPSQRYLFG